MLNMVKLEPQIIRYAYAYDVHQRKNPAEFIEAAHEFDSFPRTIGYPKLFVSEYSSPRSDFPNSTTLQAAVAEAVYMAMMEANSDIVSIATYGDLMANTEDFHGSSGVSTILIDAARSFGSPSWVVQKLFMSAQPAGLLRSVLNLSATTPPPPPPPPGPSGPSTTATGCCGYTDTGKDCDIDASGAWSAKARNISDLAGCVRAVSKCRMGNYASFQGDDCSWYQACDMGHLLQPHVDPPYQSEVVRPPPPSAVGCTAFTPTRSGGTCSFGSSTGQDQLLSASVSVSTSGEVQAKLVNYGEHTATVTVQQHQHQHQQQSDTPGANGTTDLAVGGSIGGRLSWLTGDAAHVTNSFEEPRKVKIQERDVKAGADGAFKLELPAWSVSVLVFAGV